MIQDRLSASGAFTPGQIDALAGQFTGKFILLTTLPVSLSDALAVAAVPSIAGSSVTMDHNAVRQKINTSLRISMLISIPAAVGLGVLGDPILQMLFSNHSEGGQLLRYGMISVILLALVRILTGVLQGIGRVHIPAIGALIGVLLKIPLNHFLIANPAVNINGAVISTCICYLAAAGIGIYFLRKYTGIVPSFTGAFAKPAVSAAAMGLACYSAYHICILTLGSNALATLMAIGVGVFTYLGFMVLIRGINPEDMGRVPGIKKIFNRK
jgi:stage V sporulation protein B